MYFLNGKVGFTSPTWNGYPSVNTSVATPIDSWLLANDFRLGTNLQADPNGDGVNLLVAYTLNLDPKLNLSGSMTRPVVIANQMSISFYAGSEDVTYAVESSNDMLNWSTAGVTISSLDSNKFRTATVAITGGRCLMRLVVEH